jgi:hypothetical protein
LHHELYKCDPPTPQNVGSGNGEDPNNSPYTPCPNRGYGGKHPRTGGKRIVKGIPPDNLLTIENIRKGHNLAASKLPFLCKLHEMLDDVEKTGDHHIVSWLDHGRSFRVHKPKSFVQKIIPYYFNQSKYKSFQRQLHLYEFTRITRGPEAGAYGHPKFIRGVKSICLSLSPKKIKGKFSKKNKAQKMGDITSVHREQRGSQYATTTTSTTTTSAFYPEGEGGVSMAFSESVACNMHEGGSTTYTEDAEPDNRQTQEEGKLGDPSQEWVTKLRQMLVTGASLAAQLEEKSRNDECAAPHQGDMVYVFGGMPFHYIDNNSGKKVEDAVTDDLSECGESITSC